MAGRGKELIGESARGLHNGIATFSFLLALINLILTSNAEFPSLQQQGRGEALACTVMLNYVPWAMRTDQGCSKS